MESQLIIDLRKDLIDQIKKAEWIVKEDKEVIIEKIELINSIIALETIRLIIENITNELVWLYMTQSELACGI